MTVTTSSTTSSQPPTTSTTTLDSSSVSEMPRMVISDLPDRIRIKPPPSKYHYRLTTPPYKRPDRGPVLLYSPHSSKYEFLPEPREPPSPAPNTAQSPKLEYTYTTIKTTMSSQRPETKVVVMPPYTPAPNKTATPIDKETATTLPAGSIHFTTEDFDLKSETGGGNDVSDPEKGGGSELDSESGNISHTSNKYTYKLRGGQVDYVPRPPVRHNDKVLHIFRDPHEALGGQGYRPPLFYERSPPRYPPPPSAGSPLPPLAPQHYQPYPYHVPHHELGKEQFKELSPEHKVQQFKYHSKIKYMSKEKKSNLKYKYSTPVKVQDDKPKKFLPHDKIIKATFYEDQKLIEDIDDDNVVETSDPSIKKENTLELSLDDEETSENNQGIYFKQPLRERSLFKSPKLIRTQYSVDNPMERFDEDNLFKRNLREIMNNQFQIEPSDFLSGFLPVKENNPRTGKYARYSWNLGNNRNRDLKMERTEPPTSVTKSTTTTARPSSAHTDNGEQDLLHNYSGLSANTKKYPRKQHNLLQLILKKYKTKPQKTMVKQEINVPKPANLVMKAKSASPIQSIKESLFGRFLKYFRGKPIRKPMLAEPKLFSPTLTLSTHQPKIKTKMDDEENQESERIPNEFLEDIGRHKGAGVTDPPSSQDTYKRFLLKLEKENGRNET